MGDESELRKDRERREHKVGDPVIGIARKHGETWREVVAREAAPHGLAAECLEAFDAYVLAEDDEADAALAALWDWDCAPIVGSR